MELILIAWAVLALVAAAIAKEKGRSFFVWQLYGLVLMPVAIIHALVLRTSEPVYVPVATPSSFGTMPSVSITDELIKLANLQERGFITQDEYAAQKAKLLGGDRSGPTSAA